MGWTWEVTEEVREQALSLELSWSGAGSWGCVGGFQMGLQKGAWIAWEQRLLSPGPRQRVVQSLLRLGTFSPAGALRGRSTCWALSIWPHLALRVRPGA